MTLARSVIEVEKGSGRASTSALLAIAEKQLQERRWQSKKQENAVPFSRNVNSWKLAPNPRAYVRFRIGIFRRIPAPGLVT